MSSILRALKKVEQESASGRQPAGERATDAAVGVEAPLQLVSRRYMTVGGVILAVTLLVFSGISFLGTPEKPAVPLDDGVARMTVEKRLENAGAPDPLRGTGAPVPPAQLPASHPDKAAAGNPATLQEQLPPPTKLPEADAIAAHGVRALTPAAPQASPAPPTPAKTASAPPRPALTLEGIVWSDDPKDRMAIINGKMVHEGDVIEGVHIRSIREDDVAVAANGDRWSVRF